MNVILNDDCLLLTSNQEIPDKAVNTIGSVIQQSKEVSLSADDLQRVLYEAEHPKVDEFDRFYHQAQEKIHQAEV